MPTLFLHIFLILTTMMCYAQQSSENPDNIYIKYQKKHLKTDWKNNAKILTKKCDTLILRQICDYCLGEKSTYHPRKYSPTTSCICYSHNIFIPDKINLFLIEHCEEIKVIVIENPSDIIFKLNFKNLKKLETLSVFGNDYDCDALKTLPRDLLSISTMQNLIFEGVRFPKLEIERIKIAFPKLNFKGKIAEYEFWWDQTIPQHFKDSISRSKSMYYNGK